MKKAFPPIYCNEFGTIYCMVFMLFHTFSSPVHPADVEVNIANPQTNMLIGATHMTHMTPGGLPNGDLKIEKEDKKKHKKHKKHKKDKKDKKDRKHKKDRKDKSKVIEHDSSRAPNPLSTRDGDHAVLPTITGYRRPGASSRDPGFYPTYPAAMQPLDGHSPLPHYHEGYAHGDPNAGMRPSQDGGPPKVSLSPGEYQARDEYERKLHELQGLRQTLATEDEEKKKKKKKHKKHKKEVSF